jgi:hypothetical protein
MGLGTQKYHFLSYKMLIWAKIPLCVPPYLQPNIPKRIKEKKKKKEEEREWKLIDWRGSDKNRKD